MFEEHVQHARELARQQREKNEEQQREKKLLKEAHKQAAQEVLTALCAFHCFPLSNGEELKVVTDGNSPALRGQGQPGEYIFGLVAGGKALVTVRTAESLMDPDHHIVLKRYRIAPGGHNASTPDQVLGVVSRIIGPDLDPDCTDRELALRQAADEGDEGAKNALHDYLLEHGRGMPVIKHSA